MADPLSITASLLALITAAVKTTQVLTDTVKSYRSRDKTLKRLLETLEDLFNVLKTLEEVSRLETSTLLLLKGPVSRCSQLCRDFQTSMEDFNGKSKTGFRDWAKMEFMRGDINDFMETLAGYQATIAVALGAITMRTSRLSQQVLEEYNEKIEETTYGLKLHMQRIDEKLEQFNAGSSKGSGTSIDLDDEKQVTEQCLRICENARSYMESLTDREPSLQDQTLINSTTDPMDRFEAQLLTRKALENNRDGLVETIGRLRERLESLNTDGSPETDRERRRLEDDIGVWKQCLDLCKQVSSEVSQQKIYRIGEVVADGDSDQVVVTTLADLFDVKKALSKGRSAQLIGSMSDETLRQMSADRYGSRFGANTSAEGDIGALHSGTAKMNESNDSSSSTPHRPVVVTQRSGMETRRDKPHPNEMRKRAGEGDRTKRHGDDR